MIPVAYSANHAKHCPPTLLSQLGLISHPDTPSRIGDIYGALTERAEVRLIEPNLFDESLLTAVHSGEYLSFLKSSNTFFIDDQYYFPLEFYHSSNRHPLSIAGDFGRYCLDVCTPLSNHTYADALVSCSLAYTAAQLVQEGERFAYALCRPSGHHAMNSFMGGFCYLNNTAVAAEYLSKFGTIAVLDLDFHHGNGTQDIFYSRPDVLTVSLHANPLRHPPYYWGFADEKGEAEGYGFNVNMPLEAGITDGQYQMQLESALTVIQDFSPRFLVVALGFDTYHQDTLGDFILSSDYYSKMAATLASLKIPTTIVQEGGYHTDLGNTVVSFLNGLTM